MNSKKFATQLHCTQKYWRVVLATCALLTLLWIRPASQHADAHAVSSPFNPSTSVALGFEDLTTVSLDEVIAMSERTVIATIVERDTIFAVGFSNGAAFKTQVWSGATGGHGIFRGMLAMTKPKMGDVGDDLLIANLRTGDVQPLLSEYSIARAEWRADGGLAVVASRGTDTGLYVCDLNNNHVETIRERGVSPEFLRWSEQGHALFFVERADDDPDNVTFVTRATATGAESRTRMSESQIHLMAVLKDEALFAGEPLAEPAINFSPGNPLQEKPSLSLTSATGETRSIHDARPLRRIVGGLMLTAFDGEAFRRYAWQSESGKLYRLDESRTDADTSQALVGVAQAAYAENGLIGAWYLSFPLENRNPSTVRINSIFDHSMSSTYTANDTTVAYTGEKGEKTYGSNYTTTINGNALYGFAQPGLTPFTVNGNYQIGGNARYLYYDGHPGYDFRTRDSDQDPTNGRVNVRAAADGMVTCKGSCSEGPGAIRIDHGNGYRTVYLHLSSFAVQQDQPVTRGSVIGVSGDTGATGSPHLHFELRKQVGSNWVVVDPYGWAGGCPDPYTAAASVNFWTNSGTRWDFNSTGNTQGWTPRNVECFSVGNGRLRIDPKATDPYVEGPPMVNVSATSFNTVEVQMSSFAPDGTASIYFTTDTSTTWDANKRVDFTVTNDGALRVYRVPVSNNSQWRGQITAIRLDPSGLGRSGTSSDTVEIDYVALVNLSGNGSSTISCGQSKSGSFASGDAYSPERPGSYADNYTASLTAGQQVTIDLTAPSNFDTYLYLKNSSGQVVASNDDVGSSNYNSRIAYSVPASGAYTIEATTYSAGATSSYTLSLSCGSSGGGGSPVTILSEGAENGAPGWTVSTNVSGNNWIIQAASPRSGSYRFSSSNGANYVNNLDQSLNSPSFSLTGRTRATLSYYYLFRTELNYDFFRVEISTNGGANWTTLRNSSGTSQGWPGWAPQASIDLAPYVGYSNVKIRFRLTTDGSVVDWGAVVDDILVTAQ